MALARVLLHSHAHDAAVRVEHREAGADFVREGKQVQLVAQAAVVALFGFLEHGHVLVKLVLGLPGGAVDALQTRVVLVATPVRRGGTSERKCGNVLGGGHVRATAQVMPLHLVGTRIDVVVVGQLTRAHLGRLVRVWVNTALVLDQLELVRLVLEILGCLLRRRVDAADKLLTLFDDLLHPLFQRLQILGRERLCDIEVVVKTVVNGWADAQLRAWKFRLDSLGEYVRAGVADHGAAKLGVGRHREERGSRIRDVG